MSSSLLNWSTNSEHGDEADSENSSGRMSSCSLDSVIDYLDELLGRGGRRQSESESERVLPEVTVPLPGDSSSFQCAAVPLELDLSCASVYELPSRHQHQMGLVATEVAVDSGVDSCRSDDARSPSPQDENVVPIFADYQNISSAVPSKRNQKNKSKLRTPPVKANSPSASAADVTAAKFYEICLGHLCAQLDAGSERCISIFSLQKHQDELIELGRSSGNAGSPQSSNNHQLKNLQQRRTSEQGSPIVKHHPLRQVSHDDPTFPGAKNNGNYILNINSSTRLL